ncbi:MAG: peptide deformylase [Oscillospiraceae bacterium]|nr:peptide deformylase [Oscillospiraceae bacterium]
MALRNILKQGDPTLTKLSREVTAFDQRLHTLLDDMRDTLHAANGVGLAAPQVGILRRVVLVMEIKEEDEEAEDRLVELINPLIIEEEGEQEGYEGCLSIPGMLGIVTRPQRVKVKAQDRDGEWFELAGEGLTARAICHEIDHLNGELYTRLCDELYDVEALEAEAGEDEA